MKKIIFNLVSLFVVLSSSTCEAQLAKHTELNKEITVTERTVTGDIFGMRINDLGRATINADTFRELSNLADNRDDLKKIVALLKSKDDFLGILVFLNQKYPEAKFAPVSSFFYVTKTPVVPLDLQTGGEKLTVPVSWDVFANLSHQYREQRLGLRKPSGRSEPELTGIVASV